MKHKFKRWLSVVTVAALTGIGLTAVGAPAASAHTPSINATCEALNINLTAYAPIVPGSPGMPGKDAVPKVEHTDSEFVQQAARYKYDKAKWVWYGWPDDSSKVGNDRWGFWFPVGQTGWGERLTVDTPTEGNGQWYRYTSEQTKAENIGQPQWFHEGEYPGAPWVATGKTKPHVTQEYVAPVPAIPAVPEKANTVKVTIDGSVVVDEKFGTSWSRNLAFGDKYTAHDYRVQVYSHDGIGNLDKSGTSVPCTPPATSAGKGVTCTEAWLYPGRALVNGDHINLEVIQNGTTTQRNAYVDQNVPGGYNGLGLVINTGSGQVKVPLTQAEVQSGELHFRYSDYVTGYFEVPWVQFNSWYFNQDRNPSQYLKCGERPVPEQPEPRVSTEKWTDSKCVEPLNGKATVTEYGQDTTYPVTFDRESWTWVEGEGVVGEPYVISTKTVKSSECNKPDPTTITFEWDLSVHQPVCYKTGDPEVGYIIELADAKQINDGGWEFDGYRIFPKGEARYDSNNPQPGTYTFSVQKIGAGVSEQYPYGTILVDKDGVRIHPSNGNDTFTVTIPAAEECPKPEQPVTPETEYGEWTIVDQPVCSDTTVTEERTVQEYSDAVFDPETWTWSEPEALEPRTETRTRDLTPEELDAIECPPVDPVDPTDPTDPVDPVDPVDPTDPVDPVDPVKPVTPVVNPVSPSQVVAPATAAPKTAKAQSLAVTGTELGIGLGIVLALVIAGTVLITIRRNRKDAASVNVTE